MADPPRLRIVGVSGSPGAGGRTAAAVRAVLDATGAQTRLVELGDGPDGDDVVAALGAADAVVVGTPVYRATFSGLLKELLDRVPRGFADGEPGPLRAKPVALAATGASAHHFLALEPLTVMLSGFFAAYVVPPGLYAERADFDDAGALTGPAALETARRLGAGLGALAAAVGGSPALAAARPQI